MWSNLANSLILILASLCDRAIAFSLSPNRIHSKKAVVLSSTKTPTQEREPWDFFRFVQQSSKFVSLPKRPTKPIQVHPGDIIWLAAESSSLSSFSFAPLDDVVMGGISSSTFDNSNGKWSGYVTDQNSGGFIGIRTTPFSKPLDMTSCKGIEFKLKGVENKQFKAVIRDSTDFNGICWTGLIGGGSKWGLWGGNGNSETSYKLAFDEKLVPALFAKTVPGQVLKKDNIVGFQLVYSKVSIYL